MFAPCKFLISQLTENGMKSSYASIHSYICGIGEQQYRRLENRGSLYNTRVGLFSELCQDFDS